MRLANFEGRATIVTGRGSCDVETASDGRFSSSPDQAIGELDDVLRWWQAGEQHLDSSITTASLLAGDRRLGPPVTKPGQIFAIGLNYLSHSAEAGFDVPEEPMVFTKFASSLSGPFDEIPCTSDSVDWEVELVVVMGRTGRDIHPLRARDHIAGYCIGQDISDRALQFRNDPPQFSLAKSLEGFAPIGPWLTTVEHAEDPADLHIRCCLDEVAVQEARTSEMIFTVADLIAYLSSKCELRAGDLIFTGTPDGVGLGRKPQRYLRRGEVVVSEIEELGRLRNVVA